MKTKITFVSLMILLFVAACSKEFELQKSVFIPDAEYSNLPAYSEWGYNTFGAYYDRELFIYSEQEVPAKVVSTGGATAFILKGRKGLSYYYDNTDNEMSVAFYLTDFLPITYTDLAELNQTVIDLTSPGCKIVVTIEAKEYEAQVLNGELEFKKAQQLIVDTRQIEVILSGHFAFQALVDGEPISVSYGRFDVGVGEDNFFRY